MCPARISWILGCPWPGPTSLRWRTQAIMAPSYGKPGRTRRHPWYPTWFGEETRWDNSSPREGRHSMRTVKGKEKMENYLRPCGPWTTRGLSCTWTSGVAWRRSDRLPPRVGSKGRCSPLEVTGDFDSFSRFCLLPDLTIINLVKTVIKMGQNPRFERIINARLKSENSIHSYNLIKNIRMS